MRIATLFLFSVLALQGTFFLVLSSTSSDVQMNRNLIDDPGIYHDFGDISGNIGIDNSSFIHRYWVPYGNKVVSYSGDFVVNGNVTFDSSIIYGPVIHNGVPFVVAADGIYSIVNISAYKIYDINVRFCPGIQVYDSEGYSSVIISTLDGIYSVNVSSGLLEWKISFISEMVSAPVMRGNYTAVSYYDVSTLTLTSMVFNTEGTIISSHDLIQH